MASKKWKQPRIHHTSPLTVDRDQSLALRHARRILQSQLQPSTIPPPKPLHSPIKRPNPKRRK